MGKGEITWCRRDEEGEKFQVYARAVGNRWLFYRRQRRFDTWEPLARPPLEDWLELLDGVRRRAARRLIPLEELERLKQRIREAFPGVDLGCDH